MALDGGEAPREVVDIHLMQRFGWTPGELADVDEAEFLPGLVASNIADGARQVVAWMEASGNGAKVSKPSTQAWAAWKYLVDAEKSGDG